MLIRHVLEMAAGVMASAQPQLPTALQWHTALITHPTGVHMTSTGQERHSASTHKIPQTTPSCMFHATRDDASEQDASTRLTQHKLGRTATVELCHHAFRSSSAMVDVGVCHHSCAQHSAAEQCTHSTRKPGWPRAHARSRRWPKPRQEVQH